MATKKIKSEEIKIDRILITPRAEEILKEKVNGSRGKINEFVKKILESGISKGKYQTFLKNGDEEFYYNKCKDIYVIFVIRGNEITFIDFVTEIEFNEIRQGKSI
ncbi:MAG: hypothetical protein ABIF88_02540 [archaeon]